MPQTATAEIPSVEEPLPDKRLKGLPRAAIEKFARLKQAELRARMMADAVMLERARLIEERNDAQRRLGHFDRQYPNPVRIEENEETGGRKQVPYDPPERVELLAAFERAKRALERNVAEQQEVATNVSCESLLEWLASQGGKKFVAAPPSKFSFTRNTNLEALLEDNRLECAALRDQIGAVETAPITLAEAKAKMREEVAALAERGRPEVAHLLAGGGVRWPTEVVVSNGPAAQTVATVTAAFAIGVWAHKDAIIAALDKEIERHGDDAIALSAQDRAARISELDAKLTDLQRTGEAIAVKIEQHGRVARRHCVEPMILLGLVEA